MILTASSRIFAEKFRYDFRIRSMLSYGVVSGKNRNVTLWYYSKFFVAT